jgi:hypothetical protein
MGRVDLDGDLDMKVAAAVARPWMDRAVAGLQHEVQLRCPPARVWLTQNDDKVRPTHRDAEGQAIPTNLRFILDKPERGPTVHGQASRAVRGGGQSGDLAAKPESYGTEQGRYPRDPALSPGNRFNCRCETQTVPGMIAATVTGDPVEVAGTVVRGIVGSHFPRLAESEFGDGQDPGLHFMAESLAEFTGQLGVAP